MKMKPDDMLLFYDALEPVMRGASDCDVAELSLASIAISLKRIADAIEGTSLKLGLVDSLDNIIARVLTR